MPYLIARNVNPLNAFIKKPEVSQYVIETVITQSFNEDLGSVFGNVINSHFELTTVIF